MRPAKVLGALGLLLALAAPGHAATLILAWEFPHSYGPQPWPLTMIHTTKRATTRQTLTLKTLPQEQCKALFGKADGPAESYCASLPCPQPGAIALLLQAHEVSHPSEPLLFGMGPGCTLTSYDEAIMDAFAGENPGSTSPEEPGKTTPPDKPPGTVRTSPDTPLTSTPGPKGPEDTDAGSAPTDELADAAVPPFTPEAPALPPLEFQGAALSEEDAATVQDLSDKLTALDTRYRKALRAIYEAYTAVLAGMSPTMTPAEYERLWAAYEAAQREQDALYAEVRADWDALHAAYEALMAKLSGT